MNKGVNDTSSSNFPSVEYTGKPGRTHPSGEDRDSEPLSAAAPTGLTVDHLDVDRGERRLIHALTFAAARGDIVRLAGPNGSGKTTLLRVIAGLTEAVSGVVHWNGQPIDEDRGAYQRELVYCGHRDGLKPDLSLIENLAFEAAMRGTGAAALDEAVADFGLASLRQLPVRVLSAGQRRRASLARLVPGANALWLLDEPLTNLDSDAAGVVSARLEAHAAAGGVALVASHEPVSAGARNVRTLALAGAAA